MQTDHALFLPAESGADGMSRSTSTRYRPIWFITMTPSMPCAPSSPLAGPGAPAPRRAVQTKHALGDGRASRCEESGPADATAAPAIAGSPRSGAPRQPPRSHHGVQMQAQRHHAHPIGDEGVEARPPGSRARHVAAAGERHERRWIGGDHPDGPAQIRALEIGKVERQNDRRQRHAVQQRDDAAPAVGGHERPAVPGELLRTLLQDEGRLAGDEYPNAPGVHTPTLARPAASRHQVDSGDRRRRTWYFAGFTRGNAHAPARTVRPVDRRQSGHR